MSNSIGISEKSLDELTAEETGKLLASIGSRRKKRPFDPITVAEILKHTPSNKELAKRLGVDPRMVGMFKILLSLPEEIKPYVRSGKIGIDKAQRIASLKDTASQQFLAKAIIADSNTFTKHIVAEIVSLRNRNKNIPIEDCTNRVLKSRPIVDNRYILVISVKESLSNVLNMKAKKQGVSFRELVRAIVEQSLPSSECLLSIATHNGTILLTLNIDGWQALRQKSRSLEVPLDELVETLARQSLKIRDCK
jgi:predicted HicB family RNase H-like nuclease